MRGCLCSVTRATVLRRPMPSPDMRCMHGCWSFSIREASRYVPWFLWGKICSVSLGTFELSKLRCRSAFSFRYRRSCILSWPGASQCAPRNGRPVLMEDPAGSSDSRSWRPDAGLRKTADHAELLDLRSAETLAGDLH